MKFHQHKKVFPLFWVLEVLYPAHSTLIALSPSNENVMSLWETVWCGTKYTDRKLNCLTLDVDTCQLSSFSVPRPWRQNSTISTALVKTLALTPPNFFLSSFPSPHIPPELTVCDYKHSIWLPKASWCNTFSPFPPPQINLFFLFQVLPDKRW